MNHMDIGWFNKRPIQLFVDTSALVAIGFDLSHPAMTTIKRAIDAGDVQLVTTDILKGEFLKHSELQLQDEKDRLKRILTSRSIYGVEIEKIQKSIKDLTADQIWNVFLEEFKPKDINSRVEWQAVFKDYFDLKPPFSQKKRHEFPDAFNIKMIESLGDAKVVIISPDEDYSTWAIGRDNVTVFKHSSEFADTYLKLRDSHFSDLSLKGFESIRQSLIDRLKEKYSDNYHYTVTCSHSEVESGNVKDLHIVDFELAATDHVEEFAVFKIRLRGVSTIELSCPVVVWDSVDKEEIHMGSNSRSAEVEIEISATVTVFVNQDDPTQSDFDLSEDDFYCEDFEVPADWTSFVDDPDID